MRCIHCGNDVKTGDAACRHCGARVVRPSIDESSAGRRSAAGVATLVLVGVGVALWMASSKPFPFPSTGDDATVQAPAPAVEPAPPQPAAPPSAPPAAQAADTPAPQQQQRAPTGARETPVVPIPASPTPRPPSRNRATTEPPRGTPVPKVDAPAATISTPAPTSLPAPSRAPVRVGGSIAAPKKLKDVPPLYPQTAIQARVQGVVIIEATIGSDGTVKTARVLQSVPLLDEPALDAVRQWEYAPTLLNGVAVPVIMTVTVNFSLK